MLNRYSKKIHVKKELVRVIETQHDPPNGAAMRKRRLATLRRASTLERGLQIIAIVDLATATLCNMPTLVAVRTHQTTCTTLDAQVGNIRRSQRATVGAQVRGTGDNGSKGGTGGDRSSSSSADNGSSRSGSSSGGGDTRRAGGLHWSRQLPGLKMLHLPITSIGKIIGLILTEIGFVLTEVGRQERCFSNRVLGRSTARSDAIQMAVHSCSR